MLWPYLKIWDWDLIFGRAVKTISSLGVRSPCPGTLGKLAISKVQEFEKCSFFMY